jgi:ABC-type sugar transport system ATPase subunit
MIVTFEDISKAFGGVQALDKANLSLHGGEIRALLGGNGSGKSTLIKIASGFIHQDNGKIYIDGAEADTSSPKASKKLGIVSTAQELSILPNLSVGENITLCNIPRYKNGFTNRKKIRQETLKILERLNMAGDIDTPIAKLPVSKQYLVEFGKAMYQRADILLIDEITSALYREDVAIVKTILDEYKAQGKIILLISHRLQEIYSICDSVTVMRGGRVIETCDLRNTGEDYLLSLMVGEQYAGAPADAAEEEQDVMPEGAGETVISVKGLPIKKYGTAVDLEIKRGEIIGVAGLQGHGQSELVRSLFGLCGPVKVTLDGREITVANPVQAVKHKFAFVSGDRELEGSFRRHNLADNINAVAELVFKQKHNDVDALLKGANVKYSSIYQNITSLSGGNQQKVLFGRWTHTKPALILADDPSKGIDVQARSEMRLILQKLSRQGTSMIIVSSDEDELVSLCRDNPNARVIVLYEGNIVATLGGKDVTRNNIIVATLGKGGACA